jgi:hypothetical protein
MKVIAFVLLIILVIALGPLLGIWALNTLFPVLNIPYTLDTWAAAILIKGFFTVNVTKKD